MYINFLYTNVMREKNTKWPTLCDLFYTEFTSEVIFLARSCRKWKFREIYAFKSKFMASMYERNRWVRSGRIILYAAACFHLTRMERGSDGGRRQNGKINERILCQGGYLWNFKKRKFKIAFDLKRVPHSIFVGINFLSFSQTYTSTSRRVEN